MKISLCDKCGQLAPLGAVYGIQLPDNETTYDLCQVCYDKFIEFLEPDRIRKQALKLRASEARSENANYVVEDEYEDDDEDDDEDLDEDEGGCSVD